MPKHKSLTKKTLAIYWSHARRYPQFLVPILVIVPTATVIFRIIPPLIVANVIRRLSTDDYIKGEFLQSFQTELVLFSACTVFAGIFLYRLDIYLTGKHESYVTRDLIRSMFKKYTDLDAVFHANNFSGSLVSRANKFVSSYVRLSDTIIFQILPMLGAFVSVIIIVYPKSSAFVYVFVTCAALFIAITYRLGGRVRELNALQAEAENRNTGTLADVVTNVMAIKAFSASKDENKSFEKVTDNARERMMDAVVAVVRRDLIASIITVSLQIMALVVAVMAIVNKDANLALVFLLLSYTQYLADQLFNFQASALKNFNRSMGDAYEATQTLLTEPSVLDPDHPEKSSIKAGEISFSNVFFDHEDTDDELGLFQDFNLHVKPGEKLGLVGHSGGGKTTITKLLLRFMDIDNGQIAIDNQNITQITQDDLRASISYVPQEPLLFHRSLAENISYGMSGASNQGVIKASKLAHAHEFIKDLPEGYDTLVGERGVKLSGGQRQRVAIARAMLKNAPILVLDEATSALDSESEVLIQDALWKLMEGRTAIVIAHRLSTIQKMDRIIVLDNGKIIEEGSHKELIAKNGKYAELWNHQSGGFLED